MSLIFASRSPKAAALGLEPIRVMVVDDAVVVRGLLARWIEAEPGLRLAGSLRSGREAIEQIERADPHVVILDIDMPDTDGLAALPQLLAKKRDLVVIMASTLTRRNAEVSLRALALGAADYIPKPGTTRELTTSASFRRELLDKIHIHALGPRHCGAAGVSHANTQEAALRRVASPAIAPATEAEGIRLRPFPSAWPRVLVIGSSTGGPQALNLVLGKLNGLIDHAPVLIAQHMPSTFTTILAEHLSRVSGREAREAVAGEPVRAGRIYVAPGARHMRVVRQAGAAMIALDDGPPINFCKPAVDPLFSSAAEVWGTWTLAVVLTGMGSDGAHGAADIAAAGGAIIAQDEATSVVWGMPGAVARAGLCSAVLPLDQIAPKVIRLFSGGRP
jgi:two-component system chemotaxis response regulator CheB